MKKECLPSLATLRRRICSLAGPRALWVLAGSASRTEMASEDEREGREVPSGLDSSAYGHDGADVAGIRKLGRDAAPAGPISAARTQDDARPARRSRSRRRARRDSGRMGFRHPGTISGERHRALRPAVRPSGFRRWRPSARPFHARGARQDDGGSGAAAPSRRHEADL